MNIKDLDKSKLYLGQKVALKKWWLNKLVTRLNNLYNYYDVTHNVLLQYLNDEWYVLNATTKKPVELIVLKEYLHKERENILEITEIGNITPHYLEFCRNISAEKVMFDDIGSLDTADLENRSVRGKGSFIDKMFVVLFGWIIERIIHPNKETVFCTEVSFLGMYINSISEAEYNNFYAEIDNILHRPKEVLGTNSSIVNLIITEYNKLGSRLVERSFSQLF